MTNQKEHWENIYATKQPTDVSWFQTYPKTSMEFVSVFDLGKEAKIIDVGGGDSNFVDSLLEKGFTNITVLDISENAIERAKKRLDEKANLVKWMVSDITEFSPTEQYDFWHDRAAFHFLTSEELADKYVSIAEKGIAPNGFLVLGTFSESGPKKCSALDIHQYSEKSLSYKFEKKFNRIKCIKEDHTTPFNTTQNFLFCSFQKKRSMKNILILCTGNSCRSQIAEGYLRNFAGVKAHIWSAGIETHGVNPRAIQVMKEDGVDISHHTSNNVDEYKNIPFDFVITVCDHANEVCPVFPSTAKKIHHNFPDPAKAKGTEDEILNEFRKVRDEIKSWSLSFYLENLV